MRPTTGAAPRRSLDTGAIRDRGQLYWQARLSERYPTIETRVLDVQLEIQDAVTLAGLIRALVSTALHHHTSTRTLPPAQFGQANPELLTAAMLVRRTGTA